MGRYPGFLGRGGSKWDVRAGATERLSLITSSPAVVFLCKIDLQRGQGECRFYWNFFKRKKNISIEYLFCIQGNQAFVGELGRKKPQTTHVLLLESGGPMALTGSCSPRPEAGDRPQSCPLDWNFIAFGAGVLITTY